VNQETSPSRKRSKRSRCVECSLSAVCVTSNSLFFPYQCRGCNRVWAFVGARESPMLIKNWHDMDVRCYRPMEPMLCVECSQKVGR